MRYAEYLPSPRCAQLVERFWLLEGQALGAADAIIPDGRVELIFHYGGPFWRYLDDGRQLRQPSAMLVGQMVEPVVLAPEGVAGVAAIRLRPAAARSLLRFPLRDVSGRFVDLELTFPNVSRVREQLAEASGDEMRVRAMERWLLEMASPAPRREIEAAVARILRSRGRASIDGLSTLTGLGVRQLERRFLDDVGLSPKMFARLVRLQAALRQIRAGESLAAVAHGSGYYDQAHMTRDFRDLAAMSPGSWQTHAGDLAPLFVEK